MDYIIKSVIDYLIYFSPLILLVGIAWHLAIFGEVDRSDEHRAIAHRISKKH